MLGANVIVLKRLGLCLRLYHSPPCPVSEPLEHAPLPFARYPLH
jgi:hypothetical protein